MVTAASSRSMRRTSPGVTDIKYVWTAAGSLASQRSSTCSRIASSGLAMSEHIDRALVFARRRAARSRRSDPIAAPSAARASRDRGAPRTVTLRRSARVPGAGAGVRRMRGDLGCEPAPRRPEPLSERVELGHPLCASPCANEARARARHDPRARFGEIQPRPRNPPNGRRIGMVRCMAYTVLM